MYKVFIDGQEGTTGLRIFNRLNARNDIQLLNIEPNDRKNMDIRLENIRNADITFLCLPDQAAREIAALAPENARIIDASTAHRVDDDWVYGFPEIGADQREHIYCSNRVSVPGCHASGFISIIKPLIDYNIISKETFLSCTSITGYSGGGKPLIKEYEAFDKNNYTNHQDDRKAPGIYALTQNHKHLPEMKKISGIVKSPAFIPIVSDYYSGMLVTIPLDVKTALKEYHPDDFERVYKDFYSQEKMVHVIRLDNDGKSETLYANKMADRDDMEIIIYGNEEKIVISSRYDNLGKGASGAAIQCMNIMLGLEETTSLVKGNNYEK